MDPLKKVTALDPTKKALTFYQEFKAFAFKGNVIDLAVGVIIGTAFGNIIQSLVKDIIMPVIGLIMPGNEGYVGWTWQVGQKQVPFGKFIGEVVNFLIVALVLFFFIVKFLGWVMRTKKEETAALPPLTKEQELLTEIRDVLKMTKPT